MPDRLIVRRNFRSSRLELTKGARLDAQIKIIKELSLIPSLNLRKSIAVYSASDGEPDIKEWYELANTRGTSILMPRVLEKHKLAFHLYQGEEKLERNKYGIAQPSASSPQADKNSIDAFIVPLVSYDLQGNRLGMGGGYYDRYLSKYEKINRPLILGLAFAVQCSDSPLTTNLWDIKLDGVVTEMGLTIFNPTKLK